MKNRTKRGFRKLRKGFVSLEIIIYLAIFGFVVGALFLLTYPSIKASVDANNFKSEFSIISQGLDQYYSNNYQYPNAGDWSWDNADTYIGRPLKAKGWQYSCNGGSTITLTTPSLDAKTQQKLSEAFQKASGGVAVNGNRLNISLINKPCP